MTPAFWAAGLGVALAAVAPATADEAPKYGGILTYMIQADSPPSFRRATRGNLRDDPLGGAVLQCADTDQPG